MTRRAFTRVAIAAAIASPLVLGLTGCDPQPAVPPGTSGATLTITPSLGQVRDATVVVKNALGNIVGTGTTGSTGTLTLTVRGSGPFIVEVQGDADATYFDEGATPPQFLPFPAPRVIHALVPTGATNIGVTGLTEVAHALWAGNSVPLSNANINAANNAVLNAFAPSAPAGLNDLLTPPNALSAAPAAGSLTNNAADMYAAILAGLAELGAGETSPALAAIEQLRRDAGDGSLNGMEGSTAISNLLYPTGIATEFQTAVSNRVNAWGNTALQSTTYTVTALVEPTWTGGGGGGGGDLPATINASLAGTYTVTFNLGSGVSPSAVPYYTDGQDYTAIISGNTLTIAGIPYTDPFYRVVNNVADTANPVWFSPVVNLEWSLNNNDTGLFNEINLFDPFPSNGSGIPQFLGQFELSTNTGGGGTTPVDCSSQLATLFAAKAGNYTFTAGTVSGTLASRFTSGLTYDVTLDASGFTTVETNTGVVTLHDHSAAQDCTTTPRILWVSENGLPQFSMTFASTTSGNSTLVFTDGTSGSATLAGVPATSGGGGGGGGSNASDPSYNPLGAANGVSLTIGSHTWTMGNMRDDRPLPSTGVHRVMRADNPILYNESGVPYAYSDTTPIVAPDKILTNVVVTVNETVEGTQNCGTGLVAIEMTTTEAYDQRNYTTTACTLALDYVSDAGGIGGRIISATLSNGAGGTLTISGGQFRIYQNRGIAGPAPSTIPASAFGTIQIDSGTFEYPANQHFLMTSDDRNLNVGSSFGYVVPDAGDLISDIDWMVASDGFFTGASTYSCGTRYTGLPNNKMYMGLATGFYQFEHFQSTANTGGSCTINIEQRAGSYITGNYTAVLVNNTSQNTSVLTSDELTVGISGKFRNFITLPYAAGNGGNEGTLASQASDKLAAEVNITDGNLLFTTGHRFLFPATDMSGWLQADRFRAMFATGGYESFPSPTEAQRDYIDGPNGMQLDFLDIPLGTGTYQCGTGYVVGAATLRPQVRLDTERAGFFSIGAPATPDAGASCTITVTRYDGTAVEGTFTATFPNANLGAITTADSSLSVSGSFRWKGTSTP